MRPRPALVLLALLGLLLTACGGGPDPDRPPAEGSGWVDGEPDWDGDESASGSAAEGPMAVPGPAPAEGSSETDRQGGGPLSAGSVDDNAEYAITNRQDPLVRT